MQLRILKKIFKALPLDAHGAALHDVTSVEGGRAPTELHVYSDSCCNSPGTTYSTGLASLTRKSEVLDPLCAFLYFKDSVTLKLLC